MSDLIQEVIKKSDLKAKNSFEYGRIYRLGLPFAEVEFEENEESVLLSFNLQGLKSSSGIKNESVENKYRFLVNIGKLYESWKVYNFSLRPDNIFYDENMIPVVKFRDLRDKDEDVDDKDFIDIYKAYVGGVLGSKYTIENVIDSGVSVLEKEKSISEIYECKDIESIQDLLRKRYRSIYELEKNTKIKISKKRNKTKNIIAIASSALLFMALLLLVWLFFFRLKDSDRLVLAYESFVQKDYVDCIKSMEDVDIDDMDKTTKYILAYSYAATEDLKSDEISEIVNRISYKSDERELEYWIYLERLDCEKAEDLAKALSDDQLLIFAYMKERNVLEQDTVKSGADKQARLSQLENDIKTLGDKYSIKEDKSKDTDKGTETDSE